MTLNRRTFAIISHPDAGKTTLTEKLLLQGGAIHLAGEVKARGAARRARSDWMKIEQQRGTYGDQVYDVLGDSYINTSLQDLLIRAIREDGDPAHLAYMDEMGIWAMVMYPNVGGFGSQVQQYLHDSGLLDGGALRLRSLVLPDLFLDHGTPAGQYEEAGLNRSGIVATVLKVLQKLVREVRIQIYFSDVGCPYLLPLLDFFIEPERGWVHPGCLPHKLFFVMPRALCDMETVLRHWAAPHLPSELKAAWPPGVMTIWSGSQASLRWRARYSAMARRRGACPAGSPYPMLPRYAWRACRFTYFCQSANGNWS